MASIKLHEFPPGITGVQVGGPSALHISGNRVTTEGSLASFVMTAYNLRLHQVAGGPQWAGPSGNPLVFDVQAKAEGSGVLSMDQARRMMQTLLADRFHLKVHKETRDLPVYELVVDKGGSKLKAASPGVETKATGGFSRGLWKFSYTSFSTGDLVSRIASNFDRPLLDKTDLNGRYDIVLEYRRPSLNLPQGDRAAADPGPTIFTALAQLGLKVNRTKGPIEITMIDGAEKPSGN